MSGLPQVSPDWLLLRAAIDDRSRSAELAREAVTLLPRGLQVIHDLGSGSGAMMRWFAPRLPGPQRWVLHDADAAVLDQRDPEPVLDSSGTPVMARESVEQLVELDASALADATIVVASALLDVLTFGEARRIVDACTAQRVPALFSLTVVGRVEFDPADDLDEQFGRAFDEHQRRDADGRRLLGPDAAGVVANMFTDAGWSVRTTGTPWRPIPSDTELVSEWLDGWLGAAVEQRPGLSDVATAYRDERRSQLVDGALRVVVHHEDVLAWPA
ncbi:MAG TPA: SAM-dependent methyltransferase [Galbitalea sp.]|jgi:hypothetical protein|nr:SAM-dependent methyltransferase [Galbitalea sp.]